MVPEVDGPCKKDCSNDTSTSAVQGPWLTHVQRCVEKGDNQHIWETESALQPISWGAFHASAVKEVPEKEANITLLPLLEDKAQSISLIKHAMILIKKSIESINPGQIPVLAMDQPLYAIAKEIQWSWPDELGEHSFVVMLGGLHIEMSALRLLGDLLRGSGWTHLLVAANVTSSGIADSLLKCSHVTRSRLAHEITAVAL